MIKKRPLVSLILGEEILIDTLDNISSNKLSAIASRFEAKDIIDFYFISKTVWKGSKENSFLNCYNMARKKEALLDDPAMTAYQIEELLNQVLSEKGRVLPLMRMEIDWDSFEKDIRFYIDLTYSMQQW